MIHSTRFWKLPLALALCLALRLSAQPMPQEPATQTQTQTVPSNYDLMPNDVIDIKVFQEDDLQATLRISKDGTINFPLIGVVKVGSLTAQQAAKTIRDLLSRGYIVNPQVSVTVKEFSKHRFTVLGEVQKPGAYDLPDRDSINLLEGIGMAGGYTRIAAPGRVTLKRVVNGQEVVFKLNAKSMARDRTNHPFPLMPGDVITVGETIF